MDIIVAASPPDSAKIKQSRFVSSLSRLGYIAMGLGWIADNRHVPRLDLLGGDDERVVKCGGALGRLAGFES
jgi:hypothetical protein